MKKKLISTLAAMAVIGFTGTAQALPYGFTVVEDNSQLNPAGQLQVDVTDGGGGATLFTFSNTGNIQSTITAIYFDWETTSALTFSSYATTGNVVFNHTPAASPTDLPGGTNITFTADWATDADSPAGTDKKGIDNWTTGIQDTLTIAFTGSSFNNILSALDNENFRIGLHLQGLPNDASESYVTTNAPVPEPATMLMFGVGLAGLSGFVRKKYKE